MNTKAHRSEEQRSEEKQNGEEYRHSDITGRVIGVFYDDYNELGHGFLESGYQKAMALALEQAGRTVGRQASVPGRFRPRQVGGVGQGTQIAEVVMHAP